MTTVEIKRICAWCDLHLGYTEVPVESGNEPTHGICEPCLAEFLNPKPENKDERTDSQTTQPAS